MNVTKCFAIVVLFLFSENLLSQGNSVVIIYLDGFRSDYISRNITPNLNSLAEIGIKSESVESVFPTVFMPNFVSILSGCYPQRHGILANEFMNPKTGDIYQTSVDKTVNDSYWYNSEMLWETAQKNNVKTASIMLPCTQFQNEYKNPNYIISRDENLTGKSRIAEIMRLLNLPDAERPRIIGAYFGEIDEAGHKFGPESDEIKTEIAETDKLIGTLIDSLKAKKQFESTDIIILSAYGMANVINFQTINIDALKKIKDINVFNNGTYAYIYGDKAEIDSAGNYLSANNKFITSYSKINFPDSINIGKHPYSPDLIIIPTVGWLLNEDSKIQSSGLKGVHGYLPDTPDMKGIFIAEGKSFKNNLNIKSVRLVDIYPLICKITDLRNSGNIDGNIENIKQILK